MSLLGTARHRGQSRESGRLDGQTGRERERESASLVVSSQVYRLTLETNLSSIKRSNDGLGQSPSQGAGTQRDRDGGGLV